MKGSIVSEIEIMKRELDEEISKSFPYEKMQDFYLRTGIRVESFKVEWVDVTLLGSECAPRYRLSSVHTAPISIAIQ
jgi:hypothetical protein